MNTIIQRNWGRRSVSSIARHLICITALHEECSLDLQSMKVGESISLSYSDREEEVTLVIAEKDGKKKLIASKTEEAKGRIVIPPIYRSSSLPLKTLYAQNYLTITTEVTMARHLMRWLTKSETLQSLSLNNGVSSLFSSLRYWARYVLAGSPSNGGTA